MPDSVQQDPRYAQAVHFVQLGNQYVDVQDYAQAAQYFGKAANLLPDHPEPICRLAAALASAKREQEAIDVLNQTLTHHPDWTDAHYTMGRVLEDKGDFEGAIASYRKALQLKPKHVDALFRIACSQKFREQDQPLVDTLLALLKDPAMPAQFAVQLHQALAKAYDDLKQPKSAMAHADEARRLAKSVPGGYWLPGRTDIVKQALEPSRQTFTRAFFDEQKAIGAETHKPVLIVGMLRSGTTLLDHLLTSHSEITSIGESKFWSLVARRAEKALNANDLTFVKQVQIEYETLLGSADPNAQRVIDKAPLNFPYVGIAHTLFPNARIIHTKRHPVDIALSLYLTPQVWIGPLAQDRRSIVDFYRMYDEYMALWRQVLPSDRFLEVQYEDLVADKEGTLRKVVSFLGLDWDDACLHHEANERIVNTPSRWQVRQPVYKSSVARWRTYGPWLDEFADLLTPEERASIDAARA